MSRYLIAAISAFLCLGLASAWNGRLMRQTLAQVESHVVSANQQRMEIGRLNAGFTSTEGRPRTEDSVVASADKIAPWLVSGTPSLAGAAIGQAALRRTIWRPAGGGAELGLDVFENAQTLAAGHFDLALVMVFALPLVILFAPRQDGVMLALGPVVSLLGILLSGAPLASADTWLRAGVWLLLTGLYGFFWLSVRRREPVYWIAGVAYVVLVALIPGLALITAQLIMPTPSRVELAAKTQAALRPVMAKTSRDLAPYYESHPEFAAGSVTPADYDRVRLAAEAEWHAAVEPLLAQAESDAATHRMAATILASLSPAAIFHLALLETAGTGVSRQADFEASAKEFGRKWAAEIKARVGRGHPMRPADLDQLPTFRYQEQSMMGWLFPAGLGLLGLMAWLGLLRASRAQKRPRTA